MLRDKTMLPLAVLFLLQLAELHVQAEGQAALFYKNDVLDPQHYVQENQQVARQARQSPSPTDITVRNILQWLQQRSNKDKESKDLGRKARDNGESLPARTYLPAEVPIPVDIPFQTSAQPRPFEPNPTPTQPPPQHPLPHPQPQQPAPQPQQPAPQPQGPPPQPQHPAPQPQHPAPQPQHPAPQPQEPAPQPQRPAPQPQEPAPQPQQPGLQPPYQPPGAPVFPRPTQYPNTIPGTIQTLPPTQLPPISDSDSGSYGYPYQPVPAPAFPSPSQYPSTIPGTYPTAPPAQQQPPTADSGSGGYVVSSEDTRPPGSDTAVPQGNEGTEHQAPHIHQMNVQCAKDNMIINIEFDRIFNGIIYSKGFYNQAACRYVSDKSGQKEYSLQVRLDSCGTQFVDQLREGGQAYLENVLVMQNEVGIQEVWDTVRSVRCLWEGNINKALSVELSVDMLQQEVVTFSGDTAVATLDIQMGKGPFAPKATGLVKIGEPMTLVITVEGDPGFDIEVHECVAKDSTGVNSVQLTDENGCILRPKLMSPFQKTRDPGTSAVIAFAHFQAFKFPDVMDLTVECDIELCKANCQPICTEIGQGPERLIRRRRDLYMDNSTLGDAVRIHRSFWVVSPDDIQDSKGATVINLGSSNEGVCMSVPGFILTSMLLLSVLIASSVLCAYLWLKREPKHLVARTIHLDSFPASKA